MYKFFGKLFVKNYNDLKNNEVRASYGKMASTVGIISNIFLGALKVILGIITASISIIADAINNITDSLSSIISLVGYKISTKKADEDHPFGHERVEFISGLIVAILMVVIACLLLKESVTKIFVPSLIKIDLITIILLFVSIVVKLLQSIFYKSVSNAISSITLKANSKDSLNDCIQTTFVLIGALIFFLFGLNLDGYFGTAIALYVIYSSIGIVKEAADPLIGTIPPKERIDELKHIIKSHEGILGVHDVVIHTYGPTKLFMTAHAEVSSKVDVLVSHDLLDNIEFEFREKYNIDLTLHLDPIDDRDNYANEIRFKLRDKIKAYDERMDIHDFRLVKGETHTNLIFDCEIPCDFKLTKAETRELLNKFVKELNPKFNAVIQIDQLYDRKFD